MTAANSPRSRRLAGHRPSALSSAGRPRKVADSRRVAVRSAASGGDGIPVAVQAVPGPVAGTAAPGASTPETVAAAPDGTSVPPPGTAHVPEESDQSRFGHLRVGRLTIGLIAVAVLLGVAVGLLGWDLARTDARADARKAAQVVAAESVETILSYDHAHYDKGVAAARTLMTGAFAREYDRTIRDVRSAVMETESVVKAEVVASSVVSAEPDRVKTLLFVNQTTTGKQVEQPRVDLNRVVVTLVRGDDDGAWLVSDVDAL